MTGCADQTSFVETPEVEITWHPKVSPPDAIGPFDQAFEAMIVGSGVSAWGRSEAAALAALAERLGDLARGQPSRSELTVIGQMLAAAKRFTPGQLVDWLDQWTAETRLADSG